MCYHCVTAFYLIVHQKCYFSKVTKRDTEPFYLKVTCATINKKLFGNFSNIFAVGSYILCTNYFWRKEIATPMFLGCLQTLQRNVPRNGDFWRTSGTGESEYGGVFPVDSYPWIKSTIIRTKSFDVSFVKLVNIPRKSPSGLVFQLLSCFWIFSS